MAPNEAKPRLRRAQRQAHEAARSQGVKKQAQEPLRRSARRLDAQVNLTNSEITHPISPPISSNLSKEVHQQSPSQLRPELSRVSEQQQQDSDDRGLERERKRKRSQDSEALNSEDQGDSSNKRAKFASWDSCIREKERVKNTNGKNGLSIETWTKTGYWFSRNSDPDPTMAQILNKKRSSSSLSYTQSVKEGLSPPQYTPGYEKVLENAGIYMNEEQAISTTSQKLCEVLLDSFFPPPSNSLFIGQSFLLVLNKSRSENEPRVQRDITPLLIPCASLLYLHDRIQECRYLSAKIQCEWSRVTPLAGPLPVPDYVVGLSDSAFTMVEISQLQLYTAPNKATIFRDGLYFPFLIGEVKCGEKGLSIAERQSMHVASVAVNAIVQLYRAVSRLGELDRQILVFSISHNHTRVIIHGHYARIEGEKITFYRHQIRSFDISDQNGKERWTTYHIVRKVYDYFVPIHLQRIRDALEQLATGLSFELSSVSLESSRGIDQNGGGGDDDDDVVESASQEVSESSISSSRGTDRAKKPRLKPTAMLQQEIDANRERNKELKEQIQGLVQELREQKEEFRVQKEAFVEQLKEQKEANKKLMQILDRKLS